MASGKQPAFDIAVKLRAAKPCFRKHRGYTKKLFVRRKRIGYMCCLFHTNHKYTLSGCVCKRQNYLIPSHTVTLADGII